MGAFETEGEEMKIIETIGVIFYALTIGSLFGLCIYIFVYLTIFVEMPEYEIVFRIIGFMMFNSVIAYVCGLILNGYEKTKNNNKKTRTHIRVYYLQSTYYLKLITHYLQLSFPTSLLPNFPTF